MSFVITFPQALASLHKKPRNFIRTLEAIINDTPLWAIVNLKFEIISFKLAFLVYNLLVLILYSFYLSSDATKTIFTY